MLTGDGDEEGARDDPARVVGERGEGCVPVPRELAARYLGE
jgi:hypothetical protein